MIRFIFLLVSSLPVLAQTPNEQFIRAIKTNNIVNVKEALQQGADVNARDYKGTPAIYWATYQGDVNLVRYLLQQKADPTVKSSLSLSDGSYYGSLLCISAGENKLDMLRFLIEEIKLPINAKEYNPEEKLENGWTPLQWACSNSHERVIAYLLEKKADLNIYSHIDTAPLFLALERGDTESLLTVLKSNVNVTQLNSRDIAPIFYGLIYQDLKGVSALISKGVNFKDAKLSDQTPFQYALVNGYFDKAQLLIEKGADGASLLPDGDLPLAIAAKNGYEDLMRALLRKKVSPNAKDNSGRTALMYAAYNNQTQICKLLVKAGADLKLKDTEGKTALDYAMDHNVPEAITYLKNPASFQEPTPWQRLNSKTVMYINAGQYDKASESSKQALDYIAKQDGTNSMNYASACLNHVRMLHHLKRYEESLPYLKSVLPFIDKNQSQYPEKYREAMRMQGVALTETGQHTKAIEWYQNSPDSLTKFMNIGEAYYQLSRYLDAEKYYKKAEPLTQDNLESQLRLWNSQAILYLDMGQYTTSEVLLDQLLDTYRQNTKSEVYSIDGHLNAIHNYGSLLVQTGQYNKAELYENYVRENMEKFNLTKQPLYPIVLTALGNIKLETGRYQEAEVVLLQALQAKASLLGKNHPSYANGLALLGSVNLYNHQYDRAEDYYDEAINVLENSTGKGSDFYTSVKTNLATLFEEKKEYAQAETIMRDVMATMENNQRNKTVSYAMYAGNFSNILSQQKKYDEATIWSEKSVALFKEILPADHPYYYQELQDLALLQIKQNKMTDARVGMQASMEGLRNYYEKTFAGMDERKQLAYADAIKDRMINYQYFCLSQASHAPDLMGELFDNTLAMKGIFLNIQSKIRKQILQSGDSSKINSYRDWMKAKESLNKFYTYSKTELQSMNIDLPAWESRTRELEEGLARVAATGIKPQHIAWRDVQKTLKANEVCIETLFVHATLPDSVVNVYAFLMFDKDSAHPEVIILDKGNEINEKYFRYYQNAMKSKLPDEISYQKYWAPLLTSKLLSGGKKTIYFSADGVYHQISLSGLYNPATQRYLLDEHTINLVTSLKDLVQPDTQNNLKGDVVLLGYPTYNLPLADQQLALKSALHKTDDTPSRVTESIADISATISREITTMEVPELPGTKTEVESIEALAENNGRVVKSYLGSQALEEVIKATRNPSILHIATHGYFLKQIDDGGVGGKIFGVSAQKLNENPLLRSGLLLTGSMRELSQASPEGSIENGVLTAYEAMNLSLDHTDLVVLSACETGVGEMKTGEGVYGLQRAFAIAGARVILMSLWTVSDEATQVLMTNFYSQLFKGKSMNTAFALAQQETREQYPHPYYWSAFVLMGK